MRQRVRRRNRLLGLAAIATLLLAIGVLGLWLGLVGDTATTHNGGPKVIPQKPDSASAASGTARELHLSSRPSNARVYIEGKEIGLTPIVGHSITTGRVWLELRAPRHWPHRLEIEPGTKGVRIEGIALRPLPRVQDLRPKMRRASPQPTSRPKRFDGR